MSSQRFKPALRGILAATVVIAAGASHAPAYADPPVPETASEAVQQLRNLSHEAEKVTEQWKKAQEDHAARQAEVDKANQDIDRATATEKKARADEQALRAQVDQLVDASFRGGELNQFSALLVSETPQDFIDRSAALDSVAKTNNQAVTRLANAVRQAEQAGKQANTAKARAEKSSADAARIERDVAKRKAEMDAQIKQVRERLAQLSAADRETLQGGGQTNYQPPAPAGNGAGAKAVQAALGKQGSPYSWGATGPSSFDCSGLVYWAYQQAGVSVPRSSQSQATSGTSVSRSQLQPGDLVGYYSPVSHIGIYVGNGKVVHAPTEGDVVKVSGIDDVGNVSAMTRPS